jgi:hypothetical protein
MIDKPHAPRRIRRDAAMADLRLAMIKREKSSRRVEREYQPQPIILGQMKSVCRV